MRYSACLEWLFAQEAPSFPDRIRLAREAGLDGVEFWLWSNKDVGGIEDALRDTGVALTGFVAEPMVPLTDPGHHDAFLEGLKLSAEIARRLGAGTLIAQAGADLPGRSRSEQRDALTTCLARAADVLAGSDVVLAVEPLNTLIDHKGYFLPSTREALEIVARVDRPEIAILYDIYHSAVMGEDIADVLGGGLDHVRHVHLADHPGRGEPGSGRLDWRERVSWLESNGYQGMIGLEYRPSKATLATLALLRGDRQAPVP